MHRYLRHDVSRVQTKEWGQGLERQGIRAISSPFHTSVRVGAAERRYEGNHHKGLRREKMD
jgi:hypothetical protein